MNVDACVKTCPYMLQETLQHVCLRFVQTFLIVLLKEKPVLFVFSC